MGFLALLSIISSFSKRSEAVVAGVNDAVPVVKKSWQGQGQVEEAGVLPCSLIYACLMSWQCVFEGAGTYLCVGVRERLLVSDEHEV